MVFSLAKYKIQSFLLNKVKHTAWIKCMQTSPAGITTRTATVLTCMATTAFVWHVPGLCPCEPNCLKSINVYVLAYNPPKTQTTRATTQATGPHLSKPPCNYSGWGQACPDFSKRIQIMFLKRQFASLVCSLNTGQQFWSVDGCLPALPALNSLPPPKLTWTLWGLSPFSLKYLLRLTRHDST